MRGSEHAYRSSGPNENVIKMFIQNAPGNKFGQNIGKVIQPVHISSGHISSGNSLLDPKLPDVKASNLAGTPETNARLITGRSRRRRKSAIIAGVTSGNQGVGDDSHHAKAVGYVRLVVVSTFQHGVHDSNDGLWSMWIRLQHRMQYRL